MRRGVMSLAAIALSVPVLIAAIRGTTTVEDAAVRIVILAVAVSIIDRHIAPLLMHVVHGLGRQPANEEISS